MVLGDGEMLALPQAFICIKKTQLFDCITSIFHNVLIHLLSLASSPRLERPLVQCALWQDISRLHYGSDSLEGQAREMFKYVQVALCGT